MTTFTSWRALFVREYLEHRMAFQWAPLGILVLLGVSGLSAIGLNRVEGLDELPFLSAGKIYELGYLLLLGMWLAYSAATVFFYFGD
ncbi:MAG TPA: hypothetical protein VFE52_08585, partial [Devosia sp.]|nr:hypothetical protein [Devosia sp.]